MSEEDWDTSSSSDGFHFLVNILVAPSKTNTHLSVLFIAPQWRLDSYGTSGITRSLIKNLRAVDPEGKFINITCTVLEEETRIQRIKEAEDLKVQLKGYSHPRGRKGTVNLQWLNEYVASYYGHIVSEMNCDFIIGHVPYLVYGCLNLRDSYKEKGHVPKVILFAHELPQLENGETNEEELREWLSEADVVFSIGKSTRDEIKRQIATLGAEKVAQHKSYIPEFPIELFEVQREDRSENDVETEIMMITPVKKDDISFGMNSVARACDGFVQVTLTMLSENSGVEEWASEYKSLKIANQNFDKDKLKLYMKKSDLFVFPLKSSSCSLFGEEALAAIASGVPVLVSSHSGVGSFLLELNANGSVVDSTDERLWAERIIQKITNPCDTNDLKERLLLDTRIASTHQDFIKHISDTACTEIEIEMVTDLFISDAAIDIARKIGAKDSSDLRDPESYMIAFFQQILLLKGKLEMGLLQKYLTEDVEMIWQNLLHSVEKEKLKLLSVHKASKLERQGSKQNPLRCAKVREIKRKRKNSENTASNKSRKSQKMDKQNEEVSQDIKQLTDERLSKLSRKLTTKSGVRKLGLEGLRMRSEDVVRHLTDHSKDINTAAYDMIHYWRQSQENLIIAYDEMCNALKRVKMNLIIDEVMQ